LASEQQESDRSRKSTDFGQTWTTVIANSTNAGTDKDILAVRGNDVYVAYDHSQTVWCSSSTTVAVVDLGEG